MPNHDVNPGKQMRLEASENHEVNPGCIEIEPSYLRFSLPEINLTNKPLARDRALSVGSSSRPDNFI